MVFEESTVSASTGASTPKRGMSIFETFPSNGVGVAVGVEVAVAVAVAVLVAVLLAEAAAEGVAFLLPPPQAAATKTSTAPARNASNETLRTFFKHDSIDQVW